MLGRRLHYYFNYSSVPQTFVYAYEPGADLLTQQSLRKGQSVTIKPWDLAIVEESQ